MKKFMFSLVLIMSVLVGSIFVYAGTFDDEKCPVEITSDFNFGSEKIATFNDEKTISGTAPQGTAIDIIVSTKGFAGKYRERDRYSLEVGSSGLFSQAISLYVGENKVEFVAVSNNDEFASETVVNRKKMAIKSQLENSIYIPGGVVY